MSLSTQPTRCTVHHSSEHFSLGPRWCSLGPSLLSLAAWTSNLDEHKAAKVLCWRLMLRAWQSLLAAKPVPKGKLSPCSISVWHLIAIQLLCFVRLDVIYASERERVTHELWWFTDLLAEPGRWQVESWDKGKAGKRLRAALATPAPQFPQDLSPLGKQPDSILPTRKKVRWKRGSKEINKHLKRRRLRDSLTGSTQV